MLASITPLGERGRGRRWGSTVAAYVAGSALGGASVGALAGLLGSLVLADVGWTARAALVAAALAIGLLLELAGVLPGPRRQVDESWLDTYRGWVYGAGFGFQIGVGITTVVVTSAVYVVIAASFASASLGAGAAIGALAGALRGATLLAASRVRTPEALLRLHTHVESGREKVRRGALAGQAALLAFAVAVVVA
jgi:MFS family permease